jgi:hypothetical protein
MKPYGALEKKSIYIDFKTKTTDEVGETGKRGGLRLRAN